MIHQFVAAGGNAKGDGRALPAVQDRYNAIHPMSIAGITARSLEMLQRLQTTLEVERIIEFFAAEASTLVHLDGAQYLHDTTAIRFSWGRETPHSCAYRLTVEAEDLGELTFFRAKRFSEQELWRLEQTLTALVYPLRNSLRYRQAVSAARHDVLTGLYNRTAFNEQLNREFQIARRHSVPLSMMVIDLDHFKSINDRHGHRTGDRVLKIAAAALDDCIRESDLLFRYGGEEFVVILANSDEDCASIVAERMLTCIRETPVELDASTSVSLTASVGITELRPTDDAATLFERADQAMYAAKHAGRDRAAVL